MATKHRARDEEAWAKAKKVCRLTAPQVAMARALGMNPRKLPGLRPSAQQRWKLPVGAFIEECYRKRFDGDRGADVRAPESRPRSRSTIDVDTNVPQRASDLTRQFSDLACYAVNLANDLERWIAHGSIDPEVLPQLCEELREIASALETGAPLSSVPAIPVPPAPMRRPVSQRARSGIVIRRRRHSVLTVEHRRCSMPPAHLRTSRRLVPDHPARGRQPLRRHPKLECFENG